ncbi:MAG: tetratricopeptide repeat protein [Pseudomonadota bacterium]|nr:tetratricopeptide repeat protein [Pseudomonadota bacterium]
MIGASAGVFLIVVALVAAALAAVVALPLRKDLPRGFVAIVVLVPMFAVALYQLVGNPRALDPGARAPVPVAADGAADPAAFAAAVTQLRAELERNPDQPEGWPLLGRSLAAQGDFAGARDAFAKAVELVPDNPDLLVEAAQASAQAHPDNLFDATAISRLERAVELQPDHQRALWFIGVSQRQRGLDAEAAKTWEPLLALVDERTAASLRTQIAAARQAAGLPPLAAAAPVADKDAGLRVKVSLDPDFAARVRLRGDAVVFISVRAPGGPPMPVAAERHTLQDLPLDIVLDDSDSLMPTRKLSEMAAVEVSARISAGGTADRQEGDVESAPIRVELPSAQAVELVIGSAR